MLILPSGGDVPPDVYGNTIFGDQGFYGCAASEGGLRTADRIRADWSLSPQKEHTNIAKQAHEEAAKHHTEAAKKHTEAADKHGKGDHESAHKASEEAHTHSTGAHAKSTDAHAKSKSSAKK